MMITQCYIIINTVAVVDLPFLFTAMTKKITILHDSMSSGRFVLTFQKNPDNGDSRFL